MHRVQNKSNAFLPWLPSTVLFDLMIERQGRDLRCGSQSTIYALTHTVCHEHVEADAEEPQNRSKYSDIPNRQLEANGFIHRPGPRVSVGIPRRAAYGAIE